MKVLNDNDYTVPLAVEGDRKIFLGPRSVHDVDPADPTNLPKGVSVVPTATSQTKE